MKKTKNNQEINTESAPKRDKRKKLVLGIAIPVCVLLLAFIIGVIAVTVQAHRAGDDTSYDDEEEYTTSIAEKMLNFEGGEDPFIEGKIESTPIMLSDKHLQEFEAYLKTVKPAYEYSELYQLDEPLRRYRQKNTTHVTQHKHDIRVNGELDPDHLYKLVLKNNDAFLHDGETSEFMYDVPKKKEIKELCRWFCEVLPKYREAFPEVDMDTVCCNLYDMKILTPHSSFANAYFDENNIFNFDREQMELNDFAMDTDDVYTTTFYHEMVHACQICCDCYNNGDEWRVGIGNDYADLDSDPLSWYWLTEASAEKIESNYLQVNYSTYEMYIGYLTSLDYISQLSSAADAGMVERISFHHDMEDIFDLFDIRTEDERLEFIKMMYTVEVLEMAPTAFYTAYNEKYGVDLNTDEDAEDAFRLALKDDALLSMTKLFYRNLARQVNSGKTTLQDAYYLMRVWENKLCHHCSNHEYGLMAAFADFYRQYTEIQDAFFALLAKDNGVKEKDFVSGLRSYSINVQQGKNKKSPNCDLRFFSKAEKQYCADFIAEYYWTGRPLMRDCINLAAKCEAEMQNAAPTE